MRITFVSIFNCKSNIEQSTILLILIYEGKFEMQLTSQNMNYSIRYEKVIMKHRIEDIRV